MGYIQKDFTGSLFINDRKEKETHPDCKGTAVIGGVEYWVSAWSKTSTNGTQYQSLSFTQKQMPEIASQPPVKPPAQQSKSAPAKPLTGDSVADMDDDIPF